MGAAGEIRTCQNCGTAFMVTHGRQRFCPPPFGVKESTCAIAYRELMHREGGKVSTRLYIPLSIDERLRAYQKRKGISNKMDAIIDVLKNALC